MRSISLLLMCVFLASCASKNALREDTKTTEYREIPASGKVGTHSTATLNRLQTPTAGSATSHSRIADAESLSRFIGRRLLSSNGDYRLLLKDGTMISEKSDQAFTGKWKLAGGFLCYAEVPAQKKKVKQTADCLVMESNGSTVKLTGARGKGRSVELRVQ